MIIDMETFDASKGYKRICFREDRDLLESELNEAQEIAIHERTVLLNRVFTPGSIISGLVGTVAGDEVTLEDGVVYLDGHAVSVPGATFSFTDAGTHTIWLDVFRRIITVADDPTLVNPLTGEATAEREKWIATLQLRDTTADPLPEGATGRTVLPLYTFNRDTGALQPVVAHVVTPDVPATLASHIGHGGDEQHPVATTSLSGFMSTGDRQLLDNLGNAYDAGLLRRADLLHLVYYEVLWRLNDNCTTPATFFDYNTQWTQDQNCHVFGPDYLPYELTIQGALRWQMPIPASDGGCVAFMTRVKYTGTDGDFQIPVYFADDTLRLFFSETTGNYSSWTQAQTGFETVADPYITSGYHSARCFRMPVENGKSYHLMFLLNNTNNGFWGLYLKNFINNGEYGFSFDPQYPLW